MVGGLRRDAPYDLLVPPLILATPFVSFVNHNEYGYAAAEIWISFTGLAAAGVLCGLLIVLGGQWLRALVTAGLLTLFVDLQFAWLDPPTYVRDLCLGFGMLLLCWLLREHLSHIIARVFATMLAAGLLFPGGSGEWSAKPSLASLLTSQRNRTLRSSARRPAWGSAVQGGIHQFPLSLELRR